MIERAIPYLISFFGALIATLALTPVVREVCRRLGMVDKPDPRRINKVPIPRGGGLAIVLGVFGSYFLFKCAWARPAMQGTTPGFFWKLSTVAVLMALLGLADDRFSLRPLLKLLGQCVLAFLVWWWVDLGFADLWPSLPKGVDCLMTVFWIVGAVNAFNLIDGLDGLATGLAFIAILGMTGGLFFTQNPQATLFYFALLGGLLGFLRYNFHPASVFLGDCGSMFLGFLVGTLPLASHVPNSFLVSVGVPLLAMGVPIFDTILAIVRRSIRHQLAKRSDVSGAGNGQVMTADADHLHHRLLRMMGMNQRRAAWALYAMATVAVLVGLVGIFLQSRPAGLWLVAVAAATVVIMRDMSMVELYDAGRLLSSVVHSRDLHARRRLARLTIPLYVIADVVCLTGIYFVTAWVLRLPLELDAMRVSLPIRATCIFLFLIFFHAYGTVWGRAVTSNFVRLFLACFFGSVCGTALVYYSPLERTDDALAFGLIFGLLSYIAVAFVRLSRGMFRDLYYALDCSRLKARKDVSRILVYGAGLRYRSFRRELVRTTSANDRMIVGLLDDDVTLRGKRIGGIRILGTIHQAPEVINAVNADAVVIACDVSEGWLRTVKELLAPTGVKVTCFSFNEKEVN